MICMGSHKDHPLRIEDWGRLAYAPALARQQERNARVSAGELGPVLVLVEHDPVVTVTPRAAKHNHLLASGTQLQQAGIAVAQTDRGGDITYHGPGQLVAYPIIRLGDFGLNLGRYMRLLERVLIETVATFGIEASTEQGATGVWVDLKNTQTAAMDRHTNSNPNAAVKLCAMGVRIRKNTTMHGLALNVTTNLAHFETIIPCGLHGRRVTSMRELLGETCPEMGEVKAALSLRFQDALRPLAVVAQ